MVSLKGQYFSFDAIIGGVIFILTAMALFSYWYGISGTLDQRHESLAKEAFRISEMLYTPIDPGLAVDWRDAHLNYSRVGEICGSGTSPQEAFGSGYGVSISFNEVDKEKDPEGRGRIDPVCVWGLKEEDIQSENIYRFRRTASYQYEDGNTTLGYVDIFVYEQVLS